MNILELMAAPFAECLILVAIHTYLGIHVLKRRVIFVDLALAQIAALGTTVGFFFGIMPETSGALAFSMVFTFLGAAVFSITRFKNEKVPQEAIIGLTYAISCAVAVLVVEKTRGAEHLKDILVGNLLWVTWSDVGTAALVYLAIGIVHFLFRKKFFLISEDSDAAFRAGMSVRVWDFLFYMTFGAVITFSTRVAGVLLVFVFLVAPAILAFLITDRTWLQLLIGWFTGTLVTTLGLYLSWVADLPSGPAVIALYGFALVIGGLAVYLVRAQNRRQATTNVLVGTITVLIVVSGVWFGGKWIGSSSLAVSEKAHMVEQDIHHDQITAQATVAEKQKSRFATLESLLGDCVGSRKIERHLSFQGPEEQIQHIRNKLKENNRKALEFLLIALSDPELPLLYREEMTVLLKENFGEDFGYNPDGDESDIQSALRHMCDRIRAMKKEAEKQD